MANEQENFGHEKQGEDSGQYDSGTGGGVGTSAAPPVKAPAAPVPEKGDGKPGMGAPSGGAENAKSSKITDLNEKSAGEGEKRRSKRDELKAEAERHLAVLTREGEAPHPVELGHAVVFILGVMKEYVA